MAHPVSPVVAQVHTQPDKDKSVPGHRYIEKSKVLVDQLIGSDSKYFKEGACDLLSDTAAHVGKRIIQPVNFPVLEVLNNKLHTNQQKIDWDRKNDRVNVHGCY